MMSFICKNFLFLIIVLFLLSPANAEENESKNKTIKLEARLDIPLQLNLRKSLELALNQNLDLLQAKYQNQFYRWRVWENIGNYLPDYKLGYTQQRFDGSFLIGGVFPVMTLTSSVNAFMRLDYPVFEGGKGFFSTLAAKNTYKSSKENLSSLANNVLLSVTRAYNKLLAEEAKLEVLEKSVQKAEETLQLNKNLEVQGVGTRFDVLQSEVRLAEEEQKLITQQTTLREAAILLSTLLNLDQSTHIFPDKNDLKEKELFSIDKPITEIISIAKGNRPELKKAQFEFLAQRNDIGVAASYFFPKINVYGQYGGTGNVLFHRSKVREVTPDSIALDENGNPVIQMVSRGRTLYQTFDSGVDLSDITSVSNVIRGAGKPFLAKVDDSLMANKSIGFQVDWSLGDGLLVPSISRVNQARNQAKVSKLNLDVLNKKVEEDVRVKYLKVQSTEKLLYVAKKRVAAATEALELAKARLENGVGINIELLEAQEQYEKSLSSEVDAIVEYNNTQAELLHSLGLISVDRLVGMAI